MKTSKILYAVLAVMLILCILIWRNNRQIETQAHSNGYSSGFADGYEEGYRIGYEEGHDQALGEWP